MSSVTVSDEAEQSGSPGYEVMACLHGLNHAMASFERLFLIAKELNNDIFPFLPGLIGYFRTTRSVHD